MTEQPTPDSRHALSFGAVADSYDRGRPGYPASAAKWLTSPEQVSVLELGAGTGKFTAQLVALGHDVHATDPDPEMLAVLENRFPDVRTSLGSAEEIPAPDSSYDVVIAAQCFHWFDLQLAIPEIVRVLRPGGRLSVVWNERDESIPWVKKFGRLIGADEPRPKNHHLPEAALKDSMKFIMVENDRHKHWQTVNRKTIWDLVRSRSHIAVLDEAAQEEKKAELIDFYDGYGRGMDGMQLPYVANCFRARVVKVRKPVPSPAEAAAAARSTPAAARPAPRPSTGRTVEADLLRPLAILDASSLNESTGSSESLPDLAPRTEESRTPGARLSDDTVERVRPVDPPRDRRDDDDDDDDAMLLIDFR